MVEYEETEPGYYRVILTEEEKDEMYSVSREEMMEMLEVTEDELDDLLE